MTTDQLAVSKRTADFLLESRRASVANTLREIIQVATDELRQLEGGSKVYRSTRIAFLSATLTEQLAFAEGAQEQAEMMAFLTGKG